MLSVEQKYCISFSVTFQVPAKILPIYKVIPMEIPGLLMESTLDLFTECEYESWVYIVLIPALVITLGTMYNYKNI